MLTKRLNLIRSDQFLRPVNLLLKCKLNKATTMKLAEVDPEIEEELKNGAHYKRVKSFRPKIENTIPVYLEMAALKLIEDHKKPGFHAEVLEMENRIVNAQLPPEQKEVQVFAKQIEEKFVAREKSNLENYEELTADQKLEMYVERNKKIEQSVRKKIFSWKEYNWTEYQSILYLASRLSPNYLATKFVFNEIKHLDPDFQPKTLFDFGSGLGTTMHVANEMWPASIHEHINIESCKVMIDLSDLLLKNGNDKNQTMFNNIFYKQFLPINHQPTYDLVVSAFSLKELPNVDSRINIIENLWHKTEDMLVFIEHGNQAGTAAILEARSFILKMNGYDPVAIYNPLENDENPLDKSTKNPNVHIMAPCPHHYCCPRLTKEYRVFCNFQVNYFPVNYGQPSILLAKERFSYIVFRKRPKTYKKGFPEWPRVVEKPKKSGRLVNLKVCTSEGKIEHLNISKSKHTMNAYDCARACKWGDCLPCKINEVDKLEYQLAKQSKSNPTESNPSSSEKSSE